VLPGVVFAGHLVVDSAGAAGTDYAEGTDHDSTDWMTPGTSVGSLAEGWCVDEYYFQRPVPEASSS
jgi:hypothetical protein